MQRIKNFFQRNALKLLFITLITLLISVVMPLPFYSEEPGSAQNLTEHVEIANKNPDVSGEYLLTSVGIRQVNVWGIVDAWFNPHKTIISEADALGGSTMQQDQALNALFMASSINQAKVNAYERADIDYTRVFNGIYVLNVQADSEFLDVLSPGDTITSVDGKTFTSTQEFQDYIRSKGIGDALTIGFEHNGKAETAKRKTIRLGTKGELAGIGITLTEDTEIKGQPEITADLGAVGGPSGGLMLTLEMYDAITGADLARGRVIAGTGTIDPDGNVGEIGGMDKKIIAARDAGATIFFAPYVKQDKKYQKETGNTQTNYEIAKETAAEYAPDMTIVPVETLDDAIAYLR
ncbi:SepM family pheromone-processing serine protease [Weissella tructae]|uniref:endopeptidase La n=2 Tax=Weissella TaxID=46255 RepID=A0A075TYQ0_9LACO|nr:MULTISPECIES: SepM family pheromone-processing serine protease [Weissella]AIG65426.1 PDZ domain protein [Weissella tructae]AIM62739.1 PDZ domain protein [Weissella ceti]AIM64075.1 PDZ domain protein [Weissella ceti]